MSQGRSSSRTRRDKDDTTNPDVLLPGIGNYVFQKTVGEGNFAKVKLAHHKLTGQEVAIKIIDKTTLDEKKINKLYREVRIMKLLHHPNIVKLYEVIETKSTVFLVMEYASGGELYDYLVVHGKMKEKEARAKFRQILSAVSYCHKKRVIHRDLKAENLLLDANFNIKIADFGFSNYFDPDSKLDTFCGSPPYAAPELFQGRRYTGPEVDVWSLGVILYVLTTGCLPFDGKKLQEMRESVCRGKYRIPFFLSDGCEKLLKKFLVRDPARRASLEIVIDDPWINESYDHSPISTDLSTSVTEDENIIRYIEQKYKMDKDTILQAIRENIYNDISAIYYMMYFEKQAKEMNGEKVEIPAVDTNDIVKMDTPKKDTIASPTTSPAKGMPVIDEDGVLPESVIAGKSDDAKSNEVQSAVTARPPVAVARRRRAATVTGDGGANDQDQSPFNPAVPIQQVSNMGPVRPATAQPQTTIPLQTENSKGENTTPSIAPPPPESRKRTNTIVGIFRNVGAAKKEEEDTNSTNGDDSEKPRSLRFTFNSNSTSSKPPDEIMVELVRCCNKLSVPHRLITRYLLECNPPQTGKEALKMEIEVCKLPRLNNLHGLRFKRVSGSSSEYKELCEKILGSVQL